MMIMQVAPILRVRDIGAAEGFYCGVLGFERDFQYEASPAGPYYLGVSRDGHSLHLSTFGGDSVPGAAVYFYVADVDALYREFREAGWEGDGPVDQPWGLREVYVRDADGNGLRFGTRIGG